MKIFNIFLLYLDFEVEDIEVIFQVLGGQLYNLVLLDGIWGQVKGMFFYNEVFFWFKKVIIV